MSKCIDITGRKFGKLTVIEKTEKRLHGYVLWLCRCECGNTKLATTASLNSGHTTSCGCNKPIPPAKKYEVNGELLSVREIAEKYNLSIRTVKARVQKGVVGDKLCNKAHIKEVHTELGFAEPITFTEIAKKVGVSRQAIEQRFKRGCRGKELLLGKGKGGYPPCVKKEILFGEYTSVKQMAEKAGVSSSCIWQRYDRGYRGEGLIDPIRHKNRRTK